MNITHTDKRNLFKARKKTSNTDYKYNFNTLLLLWSDESEIVLLLRIYSSFVMKVEKIVQLQKNEGTHSCIELRDKMNKYVEVTETKFFTMHYSWKY